MKKIILILCTVMLLTLTGCKDGKITGRLSITSTPGKTVIKVKNSGDDAFEESGAVSISAKEAVNVVSELEKGELKIEFRKALKDSSTDPDGYIATDTVKILTVKPGDSAQFYLEEGNFIIEITAYGETEGTVKITY